MDHRSYPNNLNTFFYNARNENKNCTRWLLSTYIYVNN